MNLFLRSSIGPAIACAIVSVAFAMPAMQAVAADIVDVAPAALLKHVQMHDKVVVYFTSPDPTCGFCGGDADRAFAEAAALLENDVSVIRVQWSPWSRLPEEVKVFRVTGVPWTKVFKAGRQVYEVQGKVTNARQFSDTVRAGLRNGAAAAATAAADASPTVPAPSPHPARAGGIVKVAPAALRQHLQTHDKVVVYFTSPDPGCGYCVGTADQAFAQVAAMLDSDVSIVRVEWTPWAQLPPEVVAFGVTGVPATKVFKGGVQVAEIAGRVADVPRFAETIRTGLRKVATLAPPPASATPALPGR